MVVIFFLSFSVCHAMQKTEAQCCYEIVSIDRELFWLLMHVKIALNITEYCENALVIHVNDRKSHIDWLTDLFQCTTAWPKLSTCSRFVKFAIVPSRPFQPWKLLYNMNPVWLNSHSAATRIYTKKANNDTKIVSYFNSILLVLHFIVHTDGDLHMINAFIDHYLNKNHFTGNVLTSIIFTDKPVCPTNIHRCWWWCSINLNSMMCVCVTRW